MLSRRDNPCGGFTAQLDGTLIYCPNPPEVFMPRSKPVTMTSSPTATAFVVECATTPAASIPGVWGYFRVTALLPDADNASLYFNDEYFTSMISSPPGSSLNARCRISRTKVFSFVSETNIALKLCGNAME